MGINVEPSTAAHRRASFALLARLEHHHGEKAPSGFVHPGLAAARKKIKTLEARVAELNAANVQANESLENSKVQVGLLEQMIDKLKTDNNKLIQAALNGELVPGKRPPLKGIARIVAEFYRVTLLEISGAGRRQEIIKPRHVAMFLCREIAEASHPVIGRAFGKRDHTTSIHAFRSIGRQLKTDERLQDEIALLRLKIADAFPEATA